MVCKMVDSKIKAMLETLVPPSSVARVFYKGKADTFITFQLVLGARSAFADDAHEGMEYVYRMDIYSKTDYTALLKKAVAALIALECYEMLIDPETYENATGYFHVPITFRIMEDLQQ